MQIVWEFSVLAENVVAFVAAYGPEGEWAQLFARAEGFLGSELLCATDDPCRFITIDRWVDAADYARFQERFGAAYWALDARLEGLTVSEKKIGVFETA